MGSLEWSQSLRSSPSLGCHTSPLALTSVSSYGFPGIVVSHLILDWFSQLLWRKPSSIIYYHISTSDRQLINQFPKIINNKARNTPFSLHWLCVSSVVAHGGPRAQWLFYSFQEFRCAYSLRAFDWLHVFVKLSIILVSVFSSVNWEDRTKWSLRCFLMLQSYGNLAECVTKPGALFHSLCTCLTRFCTCRVLKWGPLVLPCKRRKLECPLPQESSSARTHNTHQLLLENVYGGEAAYFKLCEPKPSRDLSLRFHLHEIFIECFLELLWVAEAGLPGHFSLRTDPRPRALCVSPVLILSCPGAVCSVTVSLPSAPLSLYLDPRGTQRSSLVPVLPHPHVCLSPFHCCLCPEGEDFPLWDTGLCSSLLLCLPALHMPKQGETSELWGWDSLYRKGAGPTRVSRR